MDIEENTGLPLPASTHIITRSMDIETTTNTKQVTILPATPVTHAIQGPTVIDQPTLNPTITQTTRTTVTNMKASSSEWVTVTHHPNVSEKTETNHTIKRSRQITQTQISVTSTMTSNSHCVVKKRKTQAAVVIAEVAAATEQLPGLSQPPLDEAAKAAARVVEAAEAVVAAAASAKVVKAAEAVVANQQLASLLPTITKKKSASVTKDIGMPTSMTVGTDTAAATLPTIPAVAQNDTCLASTDIDITMTVAMDTQIEPADDTLRTIGLEIEPAAATLLTTTDPDQTDIYLASTDIDIPMTVGIDTHFEPADENLRTVGLEIEPAAATLPTIPDPDQTDICVASKDIDIPMTVGMDMDIEPADSNLRTLGFEIEPAADLLPTIPDPDQTDISLASKDIDIPMTDGMDMEIEPIEPVAATLPTIPAAAQTDICLASKDIDIPMTDGMDMEIEPADENLRTLALEIEPAAATLPTITAAAQNDICLTSKDIDMPGSMTVQMDTQIERASAANLPTIPEDATNKIHLPIIPDEVSVNPQPQDADTSMVSNIIPAAAQNQISLPIVQDEVFVNPQPIPDAAASMVSNIPATTQSMERCPIVVQDEVSVNPQPIPDAAASMVSNIIPAGAQTMINCPIVQDEVSGDPQPIPYDAESLVSNIPATTQSMDLCPIVVQDEVSVNPQPIPDAAASMVSNIIPAGAQTMINCPIVQDEVSVNPQPIPDAAASMVSNIIPAAAQTKKRCPIIIQDVVTISPPRKMADHISAPQKNVITLISNLFQPIPDALTVGMDMHIEPASASTLPTIPTAGQNMTRWQIVPKRNLLSPIPSTVQPIPDAFTVGMDTHIEPASAAILPTIPAAAQNQIRSIVQDELFVNPTRIMAAEMSRPKPNILRKLLSKKPQIPNAMTVGMDTPNDSAAAWTGRHVKKKVSAHRNRVTAAELSGLMPNVLREIHSNVGYPKPDVVMDTYLPNDPSASYADDDEVIEFFDSDGNCQVPPAPKMVFVPRRKKTASAKCSELIDIQNFNISSICTSLFQPPYAQESPESPEASKDPDDPELLYAPEYLDDLEDPATPEAPDAAELLYCKSSTMRTKQTHHQPLTLSAPPFIRAKKRGFVVNDTFKPIVSAKRSRYLSNTENDFLSDEFNLVGKGQDHTDNDMAGDSFMDARARQIARRKSMVGKAVDSFMEARSRQIAQRKSMAASRSMVVAPINAELLLQEQLEFMGLPATRTQSFLWSTPASTITSDPASRNCVQFVHNVPVLRGSTHWPAYLTAAAPIHVFSNPLPCMNNQFVEGMHLECIDPQNQSRICVASVVQVVAYRLLVRIDGHGPAYDFWCNADSPNIFPPGWCDETGRTLMVPPNFPLGTTFDWPTYLEGSATQPAPREFFHHLKPQPGGPVNTFRVGMKLEAEDVRDTHRLCVATVTDVLNNRVLIHLDGRNEEYDFWVPIDSPYIRPINWHKGMGYNLRPPPNFSRPFDWYMYLVATNSKAAPPDAFVLRPPKDFRPNMKLEVVDERNPSLVRPATVMQVENFELRILFDGWPDRYAFWLFDDDPDMHPTQWCERTGYPLETAPTSRPCELQCTIPTCRGVGNVKNFALDTHTTTEECPYMIDNWRMTKPNRLVEYNDILSKMLNESPADRAAVGPHRVHLIPGSSRAATPPPNQPIVDVQPSTSRSDGGSSDANDYNDSTDSNDSHPGRGIPSVKEPQPSTSKGLPEEYIPEMRGNHHFWDTNASAKEPQPSTSKGLPEEYKLALRRNHQEPQPSTSKGLPEEYKLALRRNHQEPQPSTSKGLPEEYKLALRRNHQEPQPSTSKGLPEEYKLALRRNHQEPQPSTSKDLPEEYKLALRRNHKEPQPSTSKGLPEEYKLALRRNHQEPQPSTSKGLPEEYKLALRRNHHEPQPSTSKGLPEEYKLALRRNHQEPQPSTSKGLPEEYIPEMRSNHLFWDTNANVKEPQPSTSKGLPEEYKPEMRGNHLVWDKNDPIPLNHATGRFSPNPLTWTVADLAERVRTIPECAAHVHQLIANHIDGQALLMLSESDLIDMFELDIEPAIRLNEYILELRGTMRYYLDDVD